MLNPFKLVLKGGNKVDIDPELEEKNLGGKLLEREIKRLCFCYCNSV